MKLQQPSIILFLGLGVTLMMQAQQPPSEGGCNIFPADNIWNTRIDNMPVDPNSSTYVASEGGSASPLHPDFGTVYEGEPNGLPYLVVPSTQAEVPIVFTEYPSQSDPGPYPVPADAPIEGGSSSTGDRHVLVLQSGSCELYEMYYAFPQSDGSWQAANGAIFNLNVDGPLRPAGWTSADAAGLPIFPGLVRYDEMQQALAGDGILHHAIRFTVEYSQANYLWPARHWATTSSSSAYPPMGQRFRLKASVNIQVYPGTTTPVSATNQVILRTLQLYGMIVADNGASFHIAGAPDPNWNDSDLHLLTLFNGSNFEAVDESSLMVNPNSGQAAEPVVISAPANGSNVLGNVNVTAQVSTTANIASMQFLLDGNPFSTVVNGGAASLSTAWSTATVTNGTHTLGATATTAGGETITAFPETVTVANPPLAPTNLAATVVSSTAIGLTWNGSTGLVPATGYTVYRNGLAVANVTNASYVDSHLASSTTYIYSVAAYDAAGTVSAKTPQIAVTTSHSPVPPTGIVMIP